MQSSLKRSNLALLAVATLSVAVPATPQAPPQKAPDAKEIVRRASDAAGGMDAFRNLGIVHMIRDREEVMQNGETARGQTVIVISAPGPIPARLEVPQNRVISGDDGTGGWAIQAGTPDQRQSTTYMIKRLVTTELFTLMLPFSLNWDGVQVVKVEAGNLGKRPVWRLALSMARSFFHTPQIPTYWNVYLDRESYALVRAECPPIDLGKGMKSDGMRCTWSQPVKLGGIWLPGQQTVTAVDEQGAEKAHSRIDRMSYRLLPATEATRLFGNPIPPDKRPKQKFQPPENKGQVPQQS